MDAKTVASAYRQSAIENAPPIKIIRLLYEGALRHLDRAATLGSATRDPEYTNQLTRADAIVVELRLALVHEHDADVAKNLESLYLYVEERIGKALNERSTEAIEGARSILATLLEAWAAIEIDHEAA